MKHELSEASPKMLKAQSKHERPGVKGSARLITPRIKNYYGGLYGAESSG